jgi:hypothetical protein
MIATARPLYETQADRRREASVAGIISQKLNVKLVRLPIRYSVDYAGYDIDTRLLKSWHEIKCRNYASLQLFKYYYLILSLAKLMSGLQLAETTEKPFYIYWSFLDNSIYFIEITSELIKDVADIKSGGRIDRGDPQDTEPMICFPKDMLLRFY